MTNTTTTNETVSTTTTGGTDAAGQLGWIVSWRVPETIGIHQLRDALTASGLDPELAGDMRYEHALRRALRDMSEHRVIRMLRREGSNVFFQFTKEYVEAIRANYVREAELVLDTQTGIVNADDSAIATEAQRLLREHLEKRLTTDLTRLVQRVYDAQKADLIPVREQGGAYFVPSHHDALVEKTRNLLTAIGGKLRSFAVRLGSDETKESVAESMGDYFIDLIGQFRKTCENLNEDSRTDVRERRMQSVADLRQKLELYQGLMTGFAERIGTEIGAAEQEMLAALLRPAPAEAAVEANREETPALPGLASAAVA